MLRFTESLLKFKYQILHDILKLPNEIEGLDFGQMSCKYSGQTVQRNGFVFAYTARICDN